MNEWRKSPFHYTNKERRVLLLIVFFAFLGIVIPRYIAYQNSGFSYKITPQQEAVFQTLVQKQKEKKYEEHSFQKYRKNSPKNQTQAVLIKHKFNPDTLSVNSWQQLGFSPKQTQVILNFKRYNKGIHSLSDLEKIVVVDRAKIEQWKPYLVFLPRKTILLDINTAGISDWEELKGIGGVLAQRIVNYREKLGGFSNKQQLKEVYGLPFDTYKAIVGKLIYATKNTQNIKVNVLNTAELSAHPYIDFGQAKVIVAFREQHGNFRNLADFAQIKIFSEEDLLKLSPYLNFVQK
jgi:competence ComEA-like helix-hairpin-helix protein